MCRAYSKCVRQKVTGAKGAPQDDGKHIRYAQIHVVVHELAQADVDRIASRANVCAAWSAAGTPSGSAGNHRSGEAVNHHVQVRHDALSGRRYLPISVDVPATAVRVVIPKLVHGIGRGSVAIGVDELGAFAWSVAAA